jgi:head-tail adaptor
MPGAGDLRAQVKFSKPDAVPDAYGNVATGWLDMFTVAANITPRLGGETVEAARLAGRQPVVIRVRHSTDTTQIKTDWRATTVEGPTPSTTSAPRSIPSRATSTTANGSTCSPRRESRRDADGYHARH